MNRKKENINKLLIYTKEYQYKKGTFLLNIFFLVLLVDFGGVFLLKHIVTGSLIVYYFLLLVRNKKGIPSFNNFFREYFLFIFFPGILVIFSIFFHEIPFLTVITKDIHAYATWVLLPLLLNEIKCEEIIKTYMRYMKFAAIIIIFTYFVILLVYNLDGSGGIKKITDFGMEYNIGKFGISPASKIIGRFVPTVRYSWSLIIIPAIIFAGVRFNKINFLVLSTAAIITKSTAIILFSFVGIILTLVFINRKINRQEKKNLNKTILFLVLIIIFVIIFIFVSENGGIVRFMLNDLIGTSGSTQIKLLHISSIFNIMKQNLFYLLFGNGIGAEFFTEGRMASRVVVEVGHFNMARQYGLIYAMLFIIYVFWLSLRLCRTDINGFILGIGLICIFLAAGTNPLLMTQLFFIFLVISRVYISNFKKKVVI